MRKLILMMHSLGPGEHVTGKLTCPKYAQHEYECFLEHGRKDCTYTLEGKSITIKHKETCSSDHKA